MFLGQGLEPPHVGLERKKDLQNEDLSS